MKVKTDWIQYLHQFRSREIAQIFDRCPPKVFRCGLELGAGDGFQSELLSNYVAMLISTDYNQYRLRKKPTQMIRYLILDAEKVGSTFRDNEYDFIFSSSLLEHLSQPEIALQGMHHVLRNDGIMIHIMPSPFWKLCQMMLYHLNLLVTKMERYTGRGRLVADSVSCGEICYNSLTINNIKSQRNFSYWSRLLWPPPHGACGSSLGELRTFGKRRWQNLFEQNGFQVWQIRKGPVASGYGFGFDGWRGILEAVGFTSVYIYIAAKAGCLTPYLKYFV
jgi:SAM-dependent methyltransferase